MTICTITGEGASIDVEQGADGRVHFIADADIDADGANGQNGKIAAYRADNRGSEALANGGMKRLDSGKLVFIAEWGKDIVLLNRAGDGPRVLSNGVIPSRTAYRFPGMPETDHAGYVDAETVPYIVVSPLVRQRARGIVLGCKARATNLQTGRSIDCVVADIGPRNKLGELSIAAAREIGIPANPRSGGTDHRIVLYELWPGNACADSWRILYAHRRVKPQYPRRCHCRSCSLCDMLGRLRRRRWSRFLAVWKTLAL